MIDFKSASRDDLIRLVIAQHERIATHGDHRVGSDRHAVDCARGEVLAAPRDMAASGPSRQAVYAPYTEARVAQRTLSQRMAKHSHELFIFVREPDVSPDTNEAERA